MQDTSTKCICGVGPNGQFGLKLSLIYSHRRTDGKSFKGRNSEKSRRDIICLSYQERKKSCICVS